MAVLNFQQRFMLAEVMLDLDQELYHYDQAMLQIINRRRRLHRLRPGPRRRRRPRSCWVRDWLLERDRLGAYSTLFEELKVSDQFSFHNLVRMTVPQFYEILHRLEHRIKKQDTRWRRALSPGLKLAVSIRYYASGDTYKSLQYLFRVPHNSTSILVREVSEAIFNEYSPEVFSRPNTPDAWQAIAKHFETRWNFPHAIGALDGKHVAIRKPPKSGSLYYNYKGFFSIVMLALIDADYKFIWAEVGANGSSSDAQIFNDCELREVIENGTIGFPDPEPLTGGTRDVPYFIVGDDAFPMRSWLMKPYSQRGLDHDERIFNYRLSRARRISENAFGILANRFQCMLSTMRQRPHTVTSIVLACICLHNLLRIQQPQQIRGVVDEEDDDHNLIPGTWRENANLMDGMAQGGNRLLKEAKTQRNYLRNYFQSPHGRVEWQERMV